MKMPKRTTAIAAVVVLLFALTGCGEETATPADEPKPFAAPLTATEAPETPAPDGDLVASEPDGAANEAAFLSFVRTRMSSFPTQIPDATDEQLLAAASEACDRIREGEDVDRMSVIQDEKPSEVGAYYFDSNAIIAGAQMHLCADTLD